MNKKTYGRLGVLVALMFIISFSLGLVSADVPKLYFPFSEAVFDGWDKDESDDFSGDYADLDGKPSIPILWNSDFNSTGDSRWLGSSSNSHLSNFTDDLGNRGYSHLSNFTDDLGFVDTNCSNNGSCSDIVYESELDYTIDTNRSDADIISVASIYNNTAWVIQNYFTKPSSYLTVLGNLAGVGNLEDDSTIVGYGAGTNNAGTFSTMLGYYAGYDNSGNNLVAVGHGAAQSNNVDRVTAVGYDAGESNTGERGSFFGYSAGKNNDGTYSTGLGAFGNYINSGDYVTAVGYSAGYQNTGDNSVFLGHQAGSGNSVSNTFILKHGVANAEPLITGDFVSGNIIVNENVTASSFIGDGSQLTGINGDNSSWNESYADSKYSIGLHTIDTNRSDADILSVASVYNDTAWVSSQGYYDGTGDLNVDGNAFGSNFYAMSSVAPTIKSFLTSNDSYSGFGAVNSMVQDVGWGFLSYGSAYGGSAFGISKANLSRLYSYGSVLAIGTWTNYDLVFGTNDQKALTIDTNQNAIFEENVTADYFVGDGSLLTGISDSDTQLSEDDVEAYIFDEDNNVNLNMTGYNVTGVDCIVFESGGSWCSA